jgi:hypothetical protein
MDKVKTVFWGFLGAFVMRSVPVILILCLTALMVIPSTVPRIGAVLSKGNNYWSAYGPNVDNLVYTVYFDFDTMFAAFQNGQLDFTDWPVSASNLANYINNPDFFVLLAQTPSGVFELDINHMDPLFNVASATDSWQENRTLGTPALVSLGTSTCAGCPPSTFHLTIQLQNLEESNTVIKDPGNRVSVLIGGTTSPIVVKADDGGTSPIGNYTIGFLSDASGISSYVLSTNVYKGSATLFTATSSTPNCLNQQSCAYALRVNYNSGSKFKPSSSGIDMGRALSHLINKPQFLMGPYLTPSGGKPLAVCDDVVASPAQNLFTGSASNCDPSSSAPNSVLTAECSDANIAALLAASGLTCAPASLYNLKSNIVNGASSCGIGTVGVTCFPSQSSSPPTGYASNVDLAAACIYFLEAGFTIVSAGAGTITQQCQNVAAGTGHIVNPNGSCNTTTAAGCVVIYPRSDPIRRASGTMFADEINYLFGTPAPNGGTVCYGGPPSFSCSLTPVYFTISQVANIVFDTSVIKDWNLYTGFYETVQIDSSYFIFHSSFAGNLCDPSAPANTGPNNYVLWCDPVFDTQTSAGEFVPGYTELGFQQAAILAATRVTAVPLYSHVIYTAALNAWSQQQIAPGTGSSIVGVKDQGLTAGFPNLISARPVPGYVPSNPLYYASGCNPSTGCTQNTLRRGLSQTTFNLSPYVFDTVWETEILNQFYDTMLAVDPNTGGLCQTQPAGTAHCIDWMTTRHSELQNSPAAGQTTWTWNLRNDIFFTDQAPVTAHDVCFSILSDRDAPSRLLASSVADVVSCTTIGTRTAQIVVSGLSPFDELNLGGLYIVPEHIWAPLCGGLKTGTDACVTPSNLASRTFDPVAAGDMVGSGPWICNYSMGVSTIPGQASCTQNANGSPGGQALAAGSKVLLKRNLGYMRCCGNIITPENGMPTTNLQALEWANYNKNGKVTILDLASAAAAFGQTCPSTPTSTPACYFAHPLYSSNPNTSTVDIGDIATVAFYFDDGLTAPFIGTPTSFLNANPPSGLNQYTSTIDPYGASSVYIQGFCIFNQCGSGMVKGTPKATGGGGIVAYDCWLESGGTTQLPFDGLAGVPGDNDAVATHLNVGGLKLPLNTSCNAPQSTAIDIVMYDAAGNPVAFEEYFLP